jgi:hypothetical protein
MRTIRRWTPFAILAIAACGGGGGATGSGAGGGGGAAQCFDYAGFEVDSPVVHFSADVLPILRGSCGVSATCHGGPTPASPPQHFFGPPNSAGAVSAAQIQAIFSGIVDQPAVEEPDMDVVKTGDPQHSFLLQKVDGLGCPTLQCAAGMACGQPMPLGGPPLAESVRDVLRRWVGQGARND